MTINSLQASIAQFAADRDWEQFHTVRSLVLAIQAELGELSEIVQWTPDQEMTPEWMANHRTRLGEEIADVFIYLLRLTEVAGIDLEDATRLKLESNAMKYPVALAHGNAKKYTEF